MASLERIRRRLLNLLAEREVEEEEREQLGAEPDAGWKDAHHSTVRKIIVAVWTYELWACIHMHSNDQRIGFANTFSTIKHGVFLYNFPITNPLKWGLIPFLMAGSWLHGIFDVWSPNW